MQDSDVEEDNIPISQLQAKTKADKPQSIEYVGEAWKVKVSPFVFIPETEDQASEKVKETTVVIDGERLSCKNLQRDYSRGKSRQL